MSFLNGNILISIISLHYDLFRRVQFTILPDNGFATTSDKALSEGKMAYLIAAYKRHSATES